MKNLEGSMSQLLDSREKKIKTLETTLKELKQVKVFENLLYSSLKFRTSKLECVPLKPL
jgi:hypothetical protein